ncbi:bifunctional precorrin-2 dehydrogenase/sirohydrochlorin ferrochelatase [Paenibacillus psychroresistens]|uniref:precorrin-2 dehydrogenase n=1 Tax=Paenibacillus psychroresistens TaxID=1778678 RepID=A0A6B8RHH8_9BACL|nr:bifunctional precorrin-2 dehydrogenase/sirohydrochlorin ferrochelatase [Paenibacillus psychroresistens]QGQ95367.1 bifunctional precorrin-2 dehydrogenase/sirohydrochlorin ferrochelatase [Paenibacillus psychroresistens]
MSTDNSTYYPILLNLNGKSCVVVGGGRVAERKIAALLEAKAKVTVISPEVTPIISEWLAMGKLEGIMEGYDSQYSSDAYLVIAATDSTEVNECVYIDSAARGQLINRVDCPEQSNFIVPAVVRRGKLSIAVSTDGASPLLAVEIRQKLEQEYGEEYELYLDFLGELRLLVQDQVLEAQERKRILKTVLELDVLGSIRNGSFNKMRLFEKLLGVAK